MKGNASVSNTGIQAKSELPDKASQTHLTYNNKAFYEEASKRHKKMRNCHIIN